MKPKPHFFATAILTALLTASAAATATAAGISEPPIAGLPAGAMYDPKIALPGEVVTWSGTRAAIDGRPLQPESRPVTGRYLITGDGARATPITGDAGEMRIEDGQAMVFTVDIFGNQGQGESR